MDCVYCGKSITGKSREHIIQNAVGGLEESTEICCPECNNYISKYIDKPFVTIFNPIIGRVNNLAKTNNGKSAPSYSGKVMYKGEVYNAVFKNGKVVSCPELSKKFKSDISKLDCRIISYDFVIDNQSFINGISKIAFNFALSKGIHIDKIKEGLIVEKDDEDKIAEIKFRYQVIPFVPLNVMDEYIELETEMLLYHNLILFSQQDKLWCYVDLFNTFQYYVLLSDKWNREEKISETYFQQLQKLDRKVPEIDRWRPKYGLLYADLYGVKPSMDKDVMQKRVAEAVQKESLKKDMANEISRKLGDDYMLNYLREDIAECDRIKYGLDMLFYFDEKDKLIKERFRTVTLTDNGAASVSYPESIYGRLICNNLDVKKYTFAKFERLNRYLCGDGQKD